MTREPFHTADALGPSKVIHVHEPTLDLKAILVIDNTAKRPALGGVRMAPDASIELTCEESGLLREVLSTYLVDFRREVAGTENPEGRRTLNRRQARLEKLMERLSTPSLVSAG